MGLLNPIEGRKREKSNMVVISSNIINNYNKRKCIKPIKHKNQHKPQVLLKLLKFGNVICTKTKVIFILAKAELKLISKLAPCHCGATQSSSGRSAWVDTLCPLLGKHV